MASRLSRGRRSDGTNVGVFVILRQAALPVTAPGDTEQPLPARATRTPSEEVIEALEYLAPAQIVGVREDGQVGQR